MTTTSDIIKNCEEVLARLESVNKANWVLADYLEYYMTTSMLSTAYLISLSGDYEESLQQLNRGNTLQELSIKAKAEYDAYAETHPEEVKLLPKNS